MLRTGERRIFHELISIDMSSSGQHEHGVGVVQSGICLYLIGRVILLYIYIRLGNTALECTIVQLYKVRKRLWLCLSIVLRG